MLLIYFTRKKTNILTKQSSEKVVRSAGFMPDTDKDIVFAGITIVYDKCEFNDDV